MSLSRCSPSGGWFIVNFLRQGGGIETVEKVAQRVAELTIVAGDLCNLLQTGNAPAAFADPRA